MSKRVKYASNGSIGIASDKVAEILEAKGVAKIIPGEPKPPKKDKGDKKDEE